MVQHFHLVRALVFKIFFVGHGISHPQNIRQELLKHIGTQDAHLASVFIPEMGCSDERIIGVGELMVQEFNWLVPWNWSGYTHIAFLVLTKYRDRGFNTEIPRGFTHPFRKLW